VFLFLPGVFLIISLFPVYRMCYQYLKFSLFRELRIEDKYIELVNIRSNTLQIIKRSELQRIIIIQSIFRIGFLSFFSYMVLYTEDRKMVVPCFIIEKEQFFKLFGPFKNTNEDRPWFPTFKKRYIR
jgi:hypothetical protein